MTKAYMNSKETVAQTKSTVLGLALHGKDTKGPFCNGEKYKKNPFLEKKAVHKTIWEKIPNNPPFL